MTIAVASLALASNTGKTTGTPAAASLPGDPLGEPGSEGLSIVAGEFAALLSGQKARGLDSDALSLLQDPTNEAELLSGAAASDTNWVFAALGIAPPSGMIARQTAQVAGEATLDATGEGTVLEGRSARQSVGFILGQTAESAKPENTDPLASGRFSLPTPGTNPAANDGLPVAGAAILAAPLAPKEFRPLQVDNVITPATGHGITEAVGAARPSVSQPGSTPSPVAAPLHDAAWPAEFSQKIVWMSRNDMQNAQITLNPPQLGPIEISLNIKNEQATAAFVSANPDVREAIESALPRLREMLAGAGVELGQANVSAESFRQADGRQANGESGKSTVTGEEGNRSVSSQISAMPERRGNGLVDTFA